MAITKDEPEDVEKYVLCVIWAKWGHLGFGDVDNSVTQESSKFHPVQQTSTTLNTNAYRAMVWKLLNSGHVSKTL